MSFVHILVDEIKNKVDLLHTVDPERYPKFGQEVAIDATAINAYSNPKKKTKDGGISDKDAEWGKRHKADNHEKDDMIWFFGYKMHSIADANYNIPIHFDTTPGNRSDIRMLRPLYKGAQQVFPWYGPEYFLGGKGYDSEAMHRHLRKQGTTGIIPPRMPTAHDGLYDGIFDANGDPTCMGLMAMEYVRTDPATKQQLWQCRAEGCHLKEGGTKAIKHCDDAIWLDPDDNPRVLGDVPRNSKQWKRLYRKRWSVERVFNSLKHSRLLESHCYRGIQKVRSHVIVSVVAFLGTVLAHLQQDNADHMGWMPGQSRLNDRLGR